MKGLTSRGFKIDGIFCEPKPFPADIRHGFSDVLSLLSMVDLEVASRILGNFNFYKALQ